MAEEGGGECGAGRGRPGRVRTASTRPRRQVISPFVSPHGAAWWPQVESIPRAAAEGSRNLGACWMQTFTFLFNDYTSTFCDIFAISNNCTLR